MFTHTEALVSTISFATIAVCHVLGLLGARRG